MMEIRVTRFYRVMLYSLFWTLILSCPVSSASPPRRIISLAPNITEMLFAMNAGDRVIGVTTFCDFPEAARRKTKIGGMSNPSLEAVISLRPDLVVMTTDGNPPEFERRLRSLGIKTYVFRARTLDELPQGIRDLGTSLGMKEQADSLAGTIENAIDRYRAGDRVSDSGRIRETGRARGADTGYRRNSAKKVLFIIWPEPLIVAGPGTEIDDAITLLGHSNVASNAGISYPRYSIEEIFHRPPDVILIGKGHADMKDMSKDLLKRLSAVPAVRHGKVFFLSDSLYRLGPRVVQGIEEMAGCLN